MSDNVSGTPTPPDQDAADIMRILINSPAGGTIEGLLSAARAYDAIRCARDRGDIPKEAQS